MEKTTRSYIKRSPVDRRSTLERRIIDLGPRYPFKERRTNKKDRRTGWEEREGWIRISKWSSAPKSWDLY